MSTFSERLKKLRNTKDKTQQDIANMLGVSRATVAGYETKDMQPDYEKLQKLADYFKVSTDYLLGQTNDPRPIDQVNEENKARISKALKDEDPELVEFWQELKEREDLFLLFKQARELDDDDIKRIIRIIKVIEDEE